MSNREGEPPHLSVYHSGIRSPQSVEIFPPVLCCAKLMYKRLSSRNIMFFKFAKLVRDTIVRHSDSKRAFVSGISVDCRPGFLSEEGQAPSSPGN